MSATAPSRPVDVEVLWFQGCPNHEDAERMVRGIAGSIGVAMELRRIEIPDEATGRVHGFPGSPTIRVDGRDVEPGWELCEDCTPRCRVYLTSAGLRGLPEAQWIEDALLRAHEARHR